MPVQGDLVAPSAEGQDPRPLTAVRTGRAGTGRGESARVEAAEVVVAECGEDVEVALTGGGRVRWGYASPSR